MHAMRKNDLLGGFALGLIALSGGWSSHASGQDAELEAKAQSNGADVGETEADPDPMSWFGIGLKLGAGGNGEGEFEITGPTGPITGKVASRAGFQLDMPINMGGDGFGWVIDPYLNFSSVDVATGAATTKSYGITTFGAYTGPTINFHVIDPLYVGFGFGPKIGYAVSDAFDYGADIMGRVPLTATYYLKDDVGLIGELGMGYGVTGTATVVALGGEPELNFGSVMTWDVAVGARWP
jgi:hypothetical protein